MRYYPTEAPGATRRRAAIVPPRHPEIAHALGPLRETLARARRRDGLTPSDRLGLLVGCSGGRDSVALLGLLSLVADADRLSLTVGHVNHGLRPDASDEATHVRVLAQGLSIPHREARLELDRQGPGIPARARAARHAVLERLRQEAGAHRLALAHTATDQAETVLLHLSRGAGLPGLAGMDAVEREVPIVRPLLEIPRVRTSSLCEALGLRYVDDPTNEDPSHPRIRIRTQVLPALASDRGGIEEALAASARAAREAEVAVQAWVAHELERRARGETRYDLSGWRGVPRAVRVAAIRAIAKRAGVDADAIGRRAVASIDRGLLAGGAKQWALRGGVRLQTDGHTLAISGRCSERASPPETT